ASCDCACALSSCLVVDRLGFVSRFNSGGRALWTAAAGSVRVGSRLKSLVSVLSMSKVRQPVLYDPDYGLGIFGAMHSLWSSTRNNIWTGSYGIERVTSTECGRRN